VDVSARPCARHPKAIFEAIDPTNGTELWVTDGTSAGTTLVKDIFPGTSGSFPGAFTLLRNGKAIFQANDGTNGTELWITDGTSAGTALVKDIWPGAIASNPSSITSLARAVYSLTLLPPI
jgi:ELWxxDGT repeat protein